MAKHSEMAWLMVAVLISVMALASASDSKALQDFCVAKATSPVNVNGLTCKDASSVNVKDFLFQGLDVPGNTSNPLGFKVTPVSAAQLAGLNTMGISGARFDFAKGGVNPPHSHPRASEIILVVQGTVEVGFITTSPENKLFSKVLQMGDVFVFPAGLVHFQRNVGSGNAMAIVTFSSQNPGLVSLASTLLGSSLDADLLARAFQVDKTTINALQSNFSS